MLIGVTSRAKYYKKLLIVKGGFQILHQLTNGGHRGEGEQERLGKSPPGVPAVDGAVVLVVAGGLHHERDEGPQVGVALVLKPLQ